MTSAIFKLLIVGGYGTFGGRLVDLLENESRLTILVAGRSAARATAFCKARPHAWARLEPVRFDRQGDLDAQLRALAPDVLVDASGPFQNYGDARYDLIQACIARRIHYLDLADGSEFVAGVSAFDTKARAAGVYVLSGVSSFPVLTAAVVRRLSSGMRRVTAIHGGIAPSPYAGVGENVIRALASYAGQPVTLRRRGAPDTAYPFTEQRRYTVSAPGCVPLRNILFSLVDVPDLRALAQLWPDADDIWMGAGPVPETLHRVLIALSWLVRWHLLPSLQGLSRLMVTVMNRVRWGEHRGGMFVAVAGLDDNARPVSRSWHLLAEGADGPLIPSMAIEAIVRRALAGRAPTPGARAATQELELKDYEQLFTHRRIVTGVREQSPKPGKPLFARLLENAWETLPLSLQAMHAVTSPRTAEGRCRIERGASRTGQAIASLFGFSCAGDDVPVSVRFAPQHDGECWTRRFGNQTLSSGLKAGRNRARYLLVERIGFLDFEQALVLNEGQLRYELRGWRAFGLRLPLCFAPCSHSHEFEQDGRFHFHVEISHPWCGPIVKYQGWLDPPHAMA